MSKVMQNSLLFVLFFLAGCANQTEDKIKKEPLICNTKNSSSTSFIFSSDQVVALQDQNKDDKEFLCDTDCKDAHSLFLDSKSCEARLTDIPVPLIAQSISASSDQEGSGMLLVYKTSLTSSELVSFYQKEMERYGWVKKYFFNGEEIVLSFEKPSRFCCITVRPAKKIWIKSKQIIFSLFMGNNE